MRQGWTIVAIPKVDNIDYRIDSNAKHFQEMNEWCNKYIPYSAWKSTIHAPSGNLAPGLKRFAFKEPKYATLFALKWL